MTPSTKLRELADELRVSSVAVLDDDGNEIRPRGWRVSVMFKGELRVVCSEATAFASKRDATLAMQALVNAGLTTAVQIQKIGLARCNQIMCEALPW